MARPAPLKSNLDLSREKMNTWKVDPFRFVLDNFHVTVDPWQKKVLNNLLKYDRIAMKACKGPGKTCLLAWVAWWYLATRPHPKIAATSISWDNLADGLWTEMAKWQGKSEFLSELFTWTKTRIFAKDFPETWWMSARTWPKSGDSNAQADTLAGLHADHILFILDEAGGIPDSVMAAAEAALAGHGEHKILISGNPTHHEGPLYRACTNERHLWYVVEITGDPDDVDRSTRVSVEWARTQIEKYGKDNPWVQVNVFGRFPATSLNSLLGPDDVAAATKRNPTPESYINSQKRLGVDVARFGDDSTILFPRQGLMAHMPVEMKNARTNEIAARIAMAKDNWDHEIEFIDDTGGFGAGVVDSLIQMGISPMPINFSGKAVNDKYYNIRSQMWMEMALWIKRGGAIPDIPELRADLTAPTYTFVNGKFRVEGKDQIKERLGRSPDYGDALALTFAIPDLPAKTSIRGMMGNNAKAKIDHDPLDRKDHKYINDTEFIYNAFTDND